MKNNCPFSGVLTALITPFKNNRVDLNAFEFLLKKQLDAKINGIVLFGTTGEPLSLSESEKKIIFHIAKEVINKKIPIICGISSPITHIAQKNALFYEQNGADGLLAITPYYYKYTSTGIFNHYDSICKNLKIPVILYNVPARTNYDLFSDATLLNKLSTIKNICAVKNAENNIEKAIKNIKYCNLPIFSGADENNFQMIKAGAVGSISVLSNSYPKTINSLYNALYENEYKKAETIEQMLKPIYMALDKTPNPIGIKYLLSVEYPIFSEDLRLPLCPPDKQIKLEILNYVKENNLE